MRSFIRRFRSEILAAWKLEARSTAAAQPLSTVMLVDHMPELLDQIAELADVLCARQPLGEAFETAKRHAVDRLAAGFDVSSVVSELSLLRGCILDVWIREHSDMDGREIRSLNMAIDRAIAVSVGRYEMARERTLAALDRVSTAALESRGLDDLLERLLKVFVETTGSVDVAAILLLEGDRLCLRATVGLDEERRRGFSLAVGEGFAGTVAAQRKPVAVRSAYLDPMVASDEMRSKHVHALYGVPLIQSERLIGVAHMGTLSEHEFSHEDRQCFSAVAARATAGIYQHMLREELAESERRHKETATSQERALAKLESLLAASPVGIGFLDRELRYLRINQALAELNGRRAEDHIGRTVAEMIPEVASSVEPMLHRVLDHGETFRNVTVTGLGGRSLLANYFPVRSGSGEITGVGGVVVDVTQEQRAREALRVEQARLESILEHSPAAIWVKDAEGRILLANQRLADALGSPREALIGHRSDEVLPAEVAAQHQQHDAIVMRENRAIEVEEVVPGAAGPRTFLSIKFPIPSTPPLVGGIATEISERKRMEDELRAAVRTREEILAIVSHDLRNPLGAIQLSVAMLQMQTVPDKPTRRHLELIHRATQRMDALIEDLLDTANIRAGRLTLDMARADIDHVVTEAIDLQKPSAAEKQIELRREPGVEGIELACDRGRILQVFGNLIGNAIKFCRAGDTITVHCEPAGNEVRFSVADTGPGIAPDVLPYLFDAYWSAPEHVRRGSGLGLYICRGIVEGHGGRIWVESTPGAGATFWFTLPIAT